MADGALPGGDAAVGGSPSPAAPASGAPASSPIALTDDSEILLPGATAPVKYKDFVGGHVSKADLTRMRQQDRAQLAQQQKALEAEKATLQRAAREVTTRFGPQAGPQGADLFAQLEALPYVDGKTQAVIVKHIVGAMQQYQQALGLMQQRVQQMEQGYGTLSGQSRVAQVQGLFSTARQNLKLPDNPQVNALIEDVYNAHDGWLQVPHAEAVAELQKLVTQRLEGLRAMFQQQNQQRADAARQTSPIRSQQPLKIARQKGRLPGSETPQELADALFPLIAGAPNT
jgi:Skp family chaperone for outer membrane proteins